MVKLSGRLKRLADEVHTGDRVADIGTDHGLLPIFLYENQVARSVILCDINAGPLEKAKENIRICGAFGLTDIRQGNGLQPLSAGEVDTVIIAGMGGPLMIDILGEDIIKTKSYQRFVLQPRNAPEKLRGWLLHNGFSIVGESLVREGRYLCEIITAISKPDRGEAARGELDLEISPLLFQKRDALLIEFLERKIAREEKIVKQVMEGSGDASHDRVRLASGRLELLTELREEARRLL